MKNPSIDALDELVGLCEKAMVNHHRAGKPQKEPPKKDTEPTKDTPKSDMAEDDLAMIMAEYEK